MTKLTTVYFLADLQYTIYVSVFGTFLYLDKKKNVSHTHTTLVNMNKGGCENSSALLIHLIFYLKKKKI